MRKCYTSKVFSKPPCLIAKIRLEKSVQLEAQQTVPHARGRIDPLEIQTDVEFEIVMQIMLVKE